MTLSRRSTIKAIGVVGTGSALTGTALAVNEHEDDQRDDEQAPEDDEEVGAIRVGHFSPDAPNVDVYVDGQQILSDVGYDELSPYLEIVPGTYTLTITAAGDDEPVYERTIVVDTEFYTAAAIGELEGESGENGDGVEEASTAAAIQESENDSDGFGNDTDAGNDTALEADGAAGNGTETNASDALEDDLETEAGDDGDDTGTFGVLLLVDSQPDDIEQEGTSPLRFVHAVPDAPAVDITRGENGTTVFEDVGFTEPSGYVSFEPGTQTVELFPADENDLEGESAGTDNDSATENDTALGEDGVISRPDPVASVELELEADTVYTAYAIGYLEEQDGEEAEVSVDEAEYATDEDEFGDDGDDEGEEADRSFSVRVAVDGEMRNEDDADEEPGVEDDELEPDDQSRSGANETESTDEAAAPTDEPTESAGGSNESTDRGMNGTDDHHADEHHADD